MKHYTFCRTPDGELKLEHEQNYTLADNDRGVESNTFTERTDINEFLRDGAVINSLYDVTLQHLFESRTRNVEARILEVFNKAYEICWMITEQEVTYTDILHNVFNNKPNFFIRDLSYCVAWSILKVYGVFYEFKQSILVSLRSCTQDKSLFSSYRELVRMQEDPCRPICFATPGVRHSHTDFCVEGLDAHSDDAKSILDFLSNFATRHSELELDEDEDDEYEMRPVDDVLEKSFTAIRTTYEAIKSENERLAFTIAEMESNQRKTIEGMEATISRLRSQITHLNKQLEASKNEVKVKEVIKENPLQKILNWDTITNYALGLGNYKDVQVICNMFNRMSSRNQYYNQNLMDNIDKLEAYIRELQKPVYNQTNHIDGDYVETQNNHHLKSETHE